MGHIEAYERYKRNYPNLNRATNVMPPPPADILGRDLSELRRALRNPEKANVALLAEPGSGKTAFVQGFAYDAESLPYYLVLEVSPERLIEKDGDRDNALLTGFNLMLDEAGQYSKEHDVILILFVDEFHKLAKISPSLMESLKPRLEKSALDGYRLVVATTFQEYNESIANNRALDQRFLQIKLAELPARAVIRVLENRAKQHGVEDLLEDGILQEIYDQSKRILISNAQPRASIDVFNSMVGDVVKRERVAGGVLHKDFYTPKELGLATDKVLCRQVLKSVIKRAHGIDIDNEVRVTDVVNALQRRLFNQENAITMVVRQLEMAACGFADLDRPKISFLSTGPTGCGKCLINDELIPAPVENGYIRNGDLKPGDWVYGRHGRKIRVTDVFDKGLRTVFRVTLTDGRVIDCGREHLWTYKCRSGNGAKHWKTVTTEELMAKRLAKPREGGRIEYDYLLPQNEAVEREPVAYRLDPYVFGAAIGNGLFRETAFTISSNDHETIQQIERLLGKTAKKCSGYSWVFVTGRHGCYDKRVQTKDALMEVPELIGKKSSEKFIPDLYKFGSIEQRWALIQGLFDTDGTIGKSSWHNVSYSTVSERLAKDVQEVLWSLGIMTSISPHPCKREWNESTSVEYYVHVKVQDKDKAKFFRLPRKLKLAEEACRVVKQREKKFDTVAIKSIEKLDKKELMTCIMVDDPEHLYLAGKGHIVTHNTEMAKILSGTMRLPLKRFDMSRYSRSEDAAAFADDLFQAVWATPNAYILIDEVEKSSKKAMNILLQVLDDARLTDSVNPDRVASFSGTIINLTTNLGSEVYQNQARHQSEDAEADVELVYKSLANSEVFETAVLGRVDVIVPFHPLPMSALEKIARRALGDVVLAAETDKRRIIVSDDVIPYIVRDRTSADTERGGARDAKRNVKNIATQVLAHYLVHAEKEVPVILYVKGKPRFKHKEIADPLNAHVALYECYGVETLTTALGKLSQSLDLELVNKGLYLPNTRPLKEYLQEIVCLAREGHQEFESMIDGETVRIVPCDEGGDT